MHDGRTRGSALESFITTHSFTFYDLFFKIFPLKPDNGITRITTHLLGLDWRHRRARHYTHRCLLVVVETTVHLFEAIR